MHLDLDDGYAVDGEDVCVTLRLNRVSEAGKPASKIIGHYGSFEQALRTYVDITARRDGGAAQILAYLVEAKAAAAEVGRAMDAERKASA